VIVPPGPVDPQVLGELAHRWLREHLHVSCGRGCRLLGRGAAGGHGLLLALGHGLALASSGRERAL
jgi:hypothetical protein